MYFKCKNLKNQKREIEDEKNILTAHQNFMLFVALNQNSQLFRTVKSGY